MSTATSFRSKAQRPPGSRRLPLATGSLRNLILLLSPLLRADGGCGKTVCGSLSELTARFSVENSTCGSAGEITFQSPAKSCSLEASAPAATGLPLDGNRNGDSLAQETNWYLFGQRAAETVRCEPRELSAGVVQLECLSDGAVVCRAQLRAVD